MDVALLADSGDECRPGFAQGDEERMNRLFSPANGDDEKARPTALQTVQGLAASTEDAQTATAEEADLSTVLLPRRVALWRRRCAGTW